VSSTLAAETAEVGFSARASIAQTVSAIATVAAARLDRNKVDLLIIHLLLELPTGRDDRAFSAGD
jgi:hypothetical protein